jgi:hypothetical protein
MWLLSVSQSGPIIMLLEGFAGRMKMEAWGEKDSARLAGELIYRVVKSFVELL